MMIEKFKIISKKIKDASEAQKGKNVYYKCTKCNDLIPSIPKDNVGCSCGNLFIDIDYFRLSIEDYNHFTVVQKI